jgi:myo-inositol 2-dehydrogenase / D-chiro-inositol 1-dehydrogenase
MADRLRLGLVGTGWITAIHLEALSRLGRTDLVGVVSRSTERAGRLVADWGGTPHRDVEHMLDTERPEVVFVCLPPARAPGACLVLIDRGIPFLTEKPLAASSAEAERVGASLGERDVVVAVGYQWRALDFLSLVRERLRARPPRLLLGRWTGGLPPPPWWRHVAESGGQVVEQATHLYDLARHLVGEGSVVGASANPVARAHLPDADVDGVAAALVRFDTGAIGSFVNASILATSQVELDVLSDGCRMRIQMLPGSAVPPVPRWSLTIEDETGERTVYNRRDPYEIQAEAFLDAVEAGDSRRVLSSYQDALVTDRLARAVVTAAGSRG